ncbi:HalOD1 output domain-containing protein [Halorubrum sp. AD140]|uniref:HalOD1 output domain-containing protein n=1 Tax=Halorubrum sp. AD140 TaxID=3050073 RepID=UPI002ACCC99A|nr:HalOD1 output domain-containing protein [Halorubrum sp. AD140]MDZ5812783.1 HalOD1 output domain-containing protein [Halorubrum sp. AD140]
MSGKSDDDEHTAGQSGDADTGPVTVCHDWTHTGRPCVTIVEAVAATTDRKPVDLPPLHDTVDADALGALLTGGSPWVTVSFTYADTDVTVEGDGSLEVRADGIPLREDDE